MKIHVWIEFVALFGIFLLPAMYLYWERSKHCRVLDSFKLRVHVNGTRGKSSVTRLIAAGLRAGGYTVVAKTTGSAARIILPDGSEMPLKRRGPANIKELIGVARQAFSLKADALVVECMAVRPELQRFSERELVKAHIGVITNVRPDHEDAWGPGYRNAALALSSAIPVKGKLVVNQETLEHLRQSNALSGREEIFPAEEDVPPEVVAGFGYEVFAENIALALKVCELAGVSKQDALDGMRKALPDIGNITVRQYEAAGKRLTFINAFAANDAESTLKLWQRYVGDCSENTVIWLNARADRKYRTVQLAETLSRVHSGKFLVTGDEFFARKRLLDCGVAAGNIITVPQKMWDNWQKLFADFEGAKVTVFAAGNIYGTEDFLACFEARAGVSPRADIFI